MFEREAQGLEALRSAVGGPVVPEPLLFGATFLLIEDLQPAPRRGDYWESFGAQLAALHQNTESRFGFWHDNYIGSTPQPNPWTEDGHGFFGEHRLVYQAHLAEIKKLLSVRDVRRIESLSAKLPDLIPIQPPALIHGDLWSGNATTNADGSPAIIDPAVYYGWAEADLAMTDLFGSFPDAFYRAYQVVRPLEKGYRQRFPLYNLFHLLNHLNLFGSSYLSQVQMVLNTFL
jgi:protein-ribulosamine 3-kinase